MSIALPFLDDLIVMSKTIPKHIEAMKLVFQAYRNANLRLNPLKCHLFTESATYLGHVVTKDGLAPCRDYVAVVKDWPMPTTRTALRAFVGKISYYRKFIRNFAAIAGPLLERLKSKDSELKDNEEFPVTDAMRKAFEDLKSRLLRAPILAYPRFHQLDTCPFIVTTGQRNSYPDRINPLNEIDCNNNQTGQPITTPLGAHSASPRMATRGSFAMPHAA